MRFKMKHACVCVMAACAVLGSAAGVAHGDMIVADLIGTRSTAVGGGLIANGNQASDGFTLDWVITFDGVTGLFHYRYEILTESGALKAVSHFNIEVSPSFASDDLLNPTVTPTIGPETLDVASGNDGMPSDMDWAVKFDGESGVYEFDSPKNPVWSDVFGKTGTGGFYNAGFGSDPVPGDTPFTNWVATPDTIEPGPTPPPLVPLPGTVWMGVALLAVMGATLRLRTKRQ